MAVTTAGKAAVSIVIPLYNQLEYTRGCLSSLLATVPANTEIIAVDNASTDGTAAYLNTMPMITTIANSANLGFAGACNKGILAAEGEWIVILNNDVVLPEGWLKGLIYAAEKWGLDVVSPAVREGLLNYDFAAHATEVMGRMSGEMRWYEPHGICFMAKRSVFVTVGIFDEGYKIGQYEDKDLFRRIRLAGFKSAITGASFIHHYGSITQHSIGAEKQVKPYALANREYYNRKWKLSWWDRFCERNIRKFKNKMSAFREQQKYSHSLFEKLLNGKVRYE